MASLLPDALRPEGWHELPLGVDAAGETAGLDLKAGPHSIIAGPTGSGKTIALLQLCTSALARGFQLVLIDPVKGGLDFQRIRPWATGWAVGSLLEAQAAVEKVYAEVQRRKAVLQAAGEVTWADLPREVRDREGVTPLLVVIDEYGSLVIEEAVPRSLDRESEYAIEAGERNAARAIISTLVGRIAREARFVGIHLALAIQRPDAAITGGELRSNLTSAVQLQAPGRQLSREALTMLMPGEAGPAAAAELSALDDGASRGLAVVAAEGGTVRGFRVGYAPAREIPQLLEDLGVPQVAQPWALEPAQPQRAAQPWQARPSAAPALPPVEVAVGEFTFSLEEEDPTA